MLGRRPAGADLAELMEESKFITQYTPYLVNFLGAIVIIIFVKKYLFAGMVSETIHNSQVERERELIKGTELISNKLKEIVKSLEALTQKVSEEIGQNTERLRSLEMAMSDYLDAFRELNDNFEKHRKNIPDTVNLKS